MIGQDRIAIDNFESKLNRLMDAYTQLAARNAELHQQVAQQAEELAEVRRQYDKLAESYTNLKLAKIISASDADMGDTQRRLSKLVREVDRCIALLNASQQTDDML